MEEDGRGRGKRGSERRGGNPRRAFLVFYDGGFRQFAIVPPPPSCSLPTPTRTDITTTTTSSSDYERVFCFCLHLSAGGRGGDFMDLKDIVYWRIHHRTRI